MTTFQMILFLTIYCKIPFVTLDGMRSDLVTLKNMGLIVNKNKVWDTTNDGNQLVLLLKARVHKFLAYRE